MKKLFAALCVVLTCLVSGCAKGEITLEVTRLGAADLSCRLTTLPVLQPTATAFEDDFRNDGYSVQKVDDGDYKGFIARKHYNQLKDIKDSKVLRTFDFHTWEKSAQGAVGESGGSAGPSGGVSLPEERHQPIVTMHSGLLFDTINVNTTVPLTPKEPIKNKQVEAIMKDIMGRIDLRFVLKLPTSVDSTNAHHVSDDGTILMWKLPLGEATPLEATVTYLNPMKAAGWAVFFIVIGGVGCAYVRKLRRQKALAQWEREQAESDHILPLPEESVQTSESSNEKSKKDHSNVPSETSDNHECSGDNKKK
jgi:hypothetical protein